MTIWLEYFSFREFRLRKSIINVVRYLNLQQDIKSGISRLRPKEQDKQEEWLRSPELQTGKVLTGIDEIAELVSVWQALVLSADDDGKTWWMLHPRAFGPPALVSSFVIGPYFCDLFPICHANIFVYKKEVEQRE